MTTCGVRAVGIAAPGLPGWAAASQVLRGAMPFVPADEPAYVPALLPPNERRRATAAVRQAFRAAEDAMTAIGGEARGLASVFASSDADMAVLHRICAALARTPRVISPTDFHNSVHNAASGYWSIAVQSMAPTTTLATYDASFASGLLEAAALARGWAGDVLLVAYDSIAPPPLFAKRSLGSSASVALVLGTNVDAPLAQLELEITGDGETVCADPGLETLRNANPALRSLPLLELLATGRSGTVTLRATGGVRVNVRCSS